MVAGVGGREGEFAGGRAFLVDDAVVVVEKFFNGYLNGDLGGGGGDAGGGVVGFGCVVACTWKMLC